MTSEALSARARGKRFSSLSLCVAAALVATLGCQDAPFTIVSVSGTVSYDDGTPIPAEEYRLRFVSQAESPDGKSFPRIATAVVDSQGVFDAATTHKYKDGLIKSEHLVYFQFGAGPGSEPLVPQDYLSSKTTPLRIDVAKTRKIEIQVPRP